MTRLAISARRSICLLAALVAAALAFAAPAQLTAQSSGASKGSCPPGQVCTNLIINDSIPPVIAVTPSGGTFGSSSLAVTVDWCDDNTLSSTSKHTTLNGTAVSLTYATSAKTGCGAHATSTGTITLASGANTFHTDICDNNANCSSLDTYYTFAAGGVMVTPDSVVATMSVNRDSAQVFTVKNTGNLSATFTLTPHCTGSALSTTCTISPSSLTLAAGASGTDTVRFHTGATGGTTGRVSSVAAGSGVSDSGTVNVTIPTVYSVNVTPKGTIAVVAASANASQVFAVTNAGNVASSFAFTASCVGTLITANSCTVSPATATGLAVGASTNVTLSFHTNAAGNGTAALRADQSGAAAPPVTHDSGWVSLSLTAPLATVSLARPYPGTTVEKSQCLHFALRPEVGSECGVLRISHALPAVRTLNKARVPTLLYYYDQAADWQVIGVNIARLTTAPVPDSVRAILFLRDSTGAYNEVQRRVYAGSAWSSTTAQRIALTLTNLGGSVSRIVGYRVQVDVKNPGQAWASATAASDGELAVVRREMAAGWHLAGLEMLYKNQWNGAILWVGGDGSTRKYTLQGTFGTNKVYTATPVDRPDTLLQSTTDSKFTRLAGNGLKIIFDSTGRHIQTVNRLRQTTSFAYSGATRKLSTITVAPASAGLVYQFAYDANGTLSSISAPGLPSSNPLFAVPRNVSITPGAAAGAIVRITDPDTSHVDFEYLAGQSGGTLISAVTDRRGTRTALDQEASSPTLGAARTTLGTQQIAQTFRNAGAIGAASGSAPTGIDSVYTRYNGVRADVSRIWLTDLGAPVSVIDPMGAKTTLTHGDARFPGLATRAVNPDSLVTAAGYDARGNMVADTVFNPLGDARNAVTNYVWDAKWDGVTRVISPTGIITETVYDSATGNPKSQQTGGVTHQATFAYYGDTSAITFGMALSTTLPTGETDEYRYDAKRGNLRFIRSPLGYLSLSFSDTLGRDTLSIAQTATFTKDTLGTPVWVGDSLGVVRTGQRVRKHFDLADQVREQWSENGPGGGGVRVPPETLQVQTVFDAGGLPIRVRRRSIPDSNAIGWIVDSTAYDGLGRDTLHTGPATLHKRYDLAGNVVWTSRGDSSVYDANGRRTRHLIPAVQWLRRDLTSINVEPDSAAADIETFTYGASGQLLAADNRYARVHRGYFRNGALRADTTLQQDYALDNTWDTTAISHVYDLEGRPIILHHGLNGPHDVRYAYDAATGALLTVTDALDSTYVYTEDASGRLTTLKYPGGTENYQYDADSRLKWINGDSLQRDPRGKVVRKTAGTSASLYTMSYSPLGNLRELIRGPGVESYTPDAFGNSTAISISGTDGGAFGPHTDGDWKRVYEPTRGAVVFASKVRDDSPHFGEYLPDGGWSYDEASNQFASESYGYRLVNFNNGIAGDSLVADTTNSWSSYDGNNHLRHVFSTTRQVYTSGMVVTDTVRMRSHEYRYDALGRRIMARYRGPYECQYTNSSDCRGTLDRQVWNGDELLFESRTVENGLPPGTANFDGTVVYTNGARLDVPLSITRSSASSICNFTIAPHADWRGHLTSGTFVGATPSCAKVAWPGNDMTAYRQGPASDKTNPWNGSIIDQGGDQSGLQYMRNRYFDPASGQFTQADPIGLAGGLNVYGYANGDPVTYSDPFGLRPLTASEKSWLGTYCDQVDCDRIKVHDGTDSEKENKQREAWLENSGGASITIGNDVYLANGANRGTLAHELTHVWQFQTTFQSFLGGYLYVVGAEQAFDGLHRKVSKSLFPRNVYGVPGLPLKKRFKNYSFNQQAEMVRECYTGDTAYCAVTPFHP